MDSKAEVFRQAEARFERTEPYRPSLVPYCGNREHSYARHDHCPQCGGARYDVDNDVCADCEAAFEAWVSEEMDKYAR